MLSKEDMIILEKSTMFRFSDEEKAVLKNKLGESITRVEKLLEVDTEKVEPLYRVYDYKQELREDEYKKELTLTRDEVLENTKEKQYGFFKLLNIMD